ncbi:hypothetical protein ABB37_09347 [Leptomonas pyrrhocoris]|uniref:Uncharacterized protein n=1 Tax=Leptomonas pyrrhocoris TaxID=157538 RepID=A0A0M9FQJ2_LEPPY|nr:hypothetical protein ABB37_09347 [Leptomonas pyrrhocoris]KPA74035.1 hypothetical protein ABB37_09347 [Leptomonas pyrrhocoris]|eukprot:XP_015652474.1 hypothetical protein ABB37_09347 [Leptomonas pyrrhocoris]
MSFMGEQSIECTFTTLRAVSPQMRLDADALMGNLGVEQNCCGVVVTDNHLVYTVTAATKISTRQRLAPSWWWVDWCGLPPDATVDNVRDIFRFR